MKISIIIPALNEEQMIRRAVLRAQAAGAYEVIVVDGGSGDGTRQAAGELDCLVLEGQRGRGVQQNLGARRASGDVLLFLHADCWLDSACLAQVAVALAGPLHAAGAFEQRIDAEGALYRLLERGNAWRVRHRGLAYGDQGIFVRRELFIQLGGFPELQLMEDLVFMKRLRRVCWPILLPGPLHISARRWQRHGVVRQTLRNAALLAAARLVSPDRLARFYAPHK